MKLYFMIKEKNKAFEEVFNERCFLSKQYLLF